MDPAELPCYLFELLCWWLNVLVIPLQSKRLIFIRGCSILPPYSTPPPTAVQPLKQKKIASKEPKTCYAATNQWQRTATGWSILLHESTTFMKLLQVIQNS